MGWPSYPKMVWLHKNGWSACITGMHHFHGGSRWNNENTLKINLLLKIATSSLVMMSQNSSRRSKSEFKRMCSRSGRYRVDSNCTRKQKSGTFPVEVVREDTNSFLNKSLKIYWIGDLKLFHFFFFFNVDQSKLFEIKIMKLSVQTIHSMMKIDYLGNSNTAEEAIKLKYSNQNNKDKDAS